MAPDHASTGRPEDAVPCPACGHAAGDSCDGPGSHPSRRRAYDAQAAAAIGVAAADHASTGRPEDAVPCPACGHAAGDSCDGPGSHPSRRRAYDAQAAAQVKDRPRYTGRVLVEKFVEEDSHKLIIVIPPGETYQASCWPRERTVVSEIVVRDFAVAELYVGNYFVPTKEGAPAAGARTYRVEPDADVPASNDVRIILKNDTSRPLRARSVDFEELP